MFRRYCTVFLLVLSLLASAALARAQAPVEKVDLETINKIKDEGLNRSQVMDLLSQMSDVYGPRLTGSPGLKAAGEWARDKLSQWGLQDARLDPWGPFGRGWTLERFSAAMLKPSYSTLIAYPKAWSPSTGGPLQGEVVFLDVQTEADLEKYRGKLKGAIVLIGEPPGVKLHFEPKARRQTDETLLAMANAAPSADAGPRRRGELSPEQLAAQMLSFKKWELVYSEGASLVVEPTGRSGDGGIVFVTAATIPTPPRTPSGRRVAPWNKNAPRVLPQIVVTPEHYNRIVRLLSKKVPVRLEVEIESRFHDDDLMSYNVVAEIPGTDLKDEIVMVGAHFDSWHAGTGATDNAAGSAVCMEALRIIQALGLKPRRTIRIGLWTGEEQGLLGSRAFVTDNFGKRIVPDNDESARDAEPEFELKPEHEKFSAYFNLDNGGGKIRGVYMQGNEAVRPIFRDWLAPFKDLGASTLSLANTGGTDHLAFDGVGLPGFQFIQDPLEYSTKTHHTNMDVYDRIQEDDLKQASVIMATFAYNAAMRTEKLPRKPLQTRARVRPE